MKRIISTVVTVFLLFGLLLTTFRAGAAPAGSGHQAQSPCSNAYFAIIDGATWTYRVTQPDGSSSTRTETVRVTGEAGGIVSFTLAYSDTAGANGEMQYQCIDGNIINASNNFIYLPTESLLVQGYSWDNYGSRVWSDKVLEFRTTTVQAGTFETMVICRNWNWNGCEPGSAQLEEYAAGIGMILSVGTTGYRLEMIDYNIPGMATPQPTATQPAPTPASERSVISGQIAFTQYSQATSGADLYLINADGTGLTRLTSGARISYPYAWSPDGTRLAFTSSDTGELTILGVDGTILTSFLPATGRYGSFAWSPDGEEIAVIQWSMVGNSNQYTIYLRNLTDGSEIPILQLPENTGILQISWSPDGQSLAFDVGTSYPGQDAPGEDCIAIVDRSGSDLRQVGEWRDPASLVGCAYDARYEKPAWSPDGEWLAYRGDFADDRGLYTVGLFLVRRDGTDNRLLATMDPMGRSNLTIEDLHWSQDGNEIYVVSNFEEAHPTQVYAVDVQSGAARRILEVADDIVNCGGPSWSSDESALALTCYNESGNYLVVYSLAEGSRQVVHTSSGQEWLAYPAWRPVPPPAKPELAVFAPLEENGAVLINGVITARSHAISRIEWDWGDGTLETGWFPARHSYLLPGTYLVRVNVIDLIGSSVSEEVTVIVPEPVLPPLEVLPPEFRLDPAVIENGLVSIDAEMIHWLDPALRLHWDWGDGVRGESGSPGRHAYAAAGTYMVTVSLVGSAGVVSTQAMEVEVDAPAPPAEAGQVCGLPALEILEAAFTEGQLAVNGAASSECAEIVRIQWEWGDGSTNDAWFPAAHAYFSAGTWRVTATATDSLGQSAVVSFPVTVATPAVLPAVDAPAAGRGTIEINVYSDVNYNGEWDLGEAWMQGVKVFVRSSSGATACEAFTDLTGRAVCSGLAFGTPYTTSIETPPDAIPSPLSRGPVTLDSDTPVGQSFGLMSTAVSSIWGSVFLDLNSNGVFDAGDRYPSADLHLRLALINADGTGQTRYAEVDPATGWYQFPELPVGQGYVVLFPFLPEGLSQTATAAPIISLSTRPVRQDFALHSSVPAPLRTASQMFPRIRFSPAVATAGQPVTFSAADSTFSGAAIQSYSWDFVDGSPVNGLQVTHTFPYEGAYTVWLTVVNTEGNSQVTSTLVQVGPAAISIPLPVPAPDADPMADFYARFYDTSLADFDDIRSMQPLSEYYAVQAPLLRGESQHYLEWAGGGKVILFSDSLVGFFVNPADPDIDGLDIAIQYLCAGADSLESWNTDVGDTGSLCSAYYFPEALTDLKKHFRLQSGKSTGDGWIYLVDALSQQFIMNPVEAESDHRLLVARVLADEADAAASLASLHRAAEERTLTTDQGLELIQAIRWWESSLAYQANLAREYAEGHVRGPNTGDYLFDILTPLMFGEISMPAGRTTRDVFTYQIDYQQQLEDLHNGRIDQLNAICMELYGETACGLSGGEQ